MRLGAGPPLDQLALQGDDWAIHAEVIRRAMESHRQELTWLAGPDINLSWFGPPT